MQTKLKKHMWICCVWGLGYTAVVTADGGLGIAYTYYEDKKILYGIKRVPGL